LLTEKLDGSEAELVREKIKGQMAEVTAESIIGNPYLANHLGIGTLVLDEELVVGLVKRNSKVAAAAGIVVHTVSGGVEPKDMARSFALAEAARREAQEELGLALEISGGELVFTLGKLIPCWLFESHVSGSWAEIWKQVSTRSFAKEGVELLLVSAKNPQAVVDAIRRLPMLNTCAYQLWHLAVRVCGEEAMMTEWLKQN
jgi:8-oxo-dGTP pyrophosphatase MutT (NUDIX family)